MSQDQPPAAQRLEIVFIGSSVPGLQALLDSPRFQVLGALCMQSRLTPAMVALTQSAGLAMIEFADRGEFRAAIESHPANRAFFIYQLDMLVPPDLALGRQFFNVHRGNLLSNRGPTPDIWPILDGDSQSTISLHRIDDKVDAGWLIDSADVPITEQDEPRSVWLRMEQYLPRLIESLAEHLQGRRPGQRLTGGRYRPWVTEADFSIDAAHDERAVIERKIRSQRAYNGALLWNGAERHYVLALLALQDVPGAGASSFVVEAATITVRVAGRELIFRRNASPKYPPLPVRPASKRI